MPGPIRDPGPGVSRARLLGALRDDPEPASGSVGSASDDLDAWTVADLRGRAAEVGIRGRSRMRKPDLIRALRSR